MSEHDVLADYLQRIGEKRSPQTFLQMLPQETKDKLLALLDQKAKMRDGKALSRWSFTQNNHRTHKLVPLSWHQRDFLRAIYADESKEIVIRKAVQVGISEWAVVDLLYMCMELGWSGAYVMTKTKARDSFVAERINKILTSVPYYRKNVGKIDNLGIKELGKGVARFLGSNAPDDFVSFPADFLIIDEVDLCDQENLKLVPDRLQASEHKFQRWIGNPTLEGYGIDALYENSDQKIWTVYCEGCKTYQTLDWFENVIEETEFGIILRDKIYRENPDQATIHPICPCGHRINRHGKGKWLRRKESPISGYTLSQIYSPTVTLEEMFIEYLDSKDNVGKLQIFYNNRLGFSFSKEGMKVTEGMLLRCEQDYAPGDEYYGENLVTAGVDVGSGALHIVIREVIEEQRRLLFVGTVTSFDALEELISRYNVAVMVIDAEPEKRLSLSFQKDHFDVVWLADYHVQESSQTDLYVHKDKQFLRSRRTSALDGLLEDIVTGNLVNFRGCKGLYNGDYYKQMCSSTRIQQDEKFVWINKSADHFMHAESYCRLALQALDNPNISFAQNEGNEDLREQSVEQILSKLVTQATENLLDLFYT